MPLLRAVLAFALGAFGGFSFVRAADAPPTVSVSAPALVEGVLPNGLRYLVLPHTAPRGGISLQLVVAAGSVDERDDERGFAHFVEHMAFNGTRHHPPGTIEEFFQRLGITPGADLNAATSYTATVYKLDLPANRADQFDQSLQLLRDYADGIAFAPAEVESEKGIVLSELRARDAGNARVNKEITRLVYAGTAVAERDPIGLPDQIARATPETLREFYRRNYQPGRMTVIVVGPMDPVGVVTKISAEFGSLAGVGSAPARVRVSLPAPREAIDANIVLNPLATAAVMSLAVLSPRAPDTADGWRQELIERVATAVLQRRMQERRDKNLDRFGPSTATMAPGIGGGVTYRSLEVQTMASRWTGAVEFAESELRRARVQGFDSSELDEAVTGLLTQLRNRVQALPSISTQQLVQELASSATAERAWRSPSDTLAFAEEQLAGLTAEEVTLALNAMFPENRMRLLVMLPKSVENGAAQAIAAYRTSAQQPLPAPRDAGGDLRFRYGDFGAPGKITSERLEADLDLTLVGFANGVQLNLRPSTHEPQRFALRATIGRGILDIAKSRPGLGQLATGLFTVSDLGRHPHGEIGRLLKLRGVAAGFSLSDDVCTISLAGPSRELPFALQLLTAFLSDLKLDPAKLRTAHSQYSAGLRQALSTPTGVARSNALYQLSANDRRLFPAPVQDVMKYKFAEIAEWVGERWFRGPLEIGIVGDFDPRNTIAAAAASVGTLAPRQVGKTTGPLAFSTKSGTKILPVKLPAGAATAYLAWPANLPDDPLNNRALQLAADVLKDRLRLKLREELGATYSPSANLYRSSQQRDYGYVWALLTFEPKQAKLLTERVVALADELAKSGVTSEELERLKEPRRTRNAEQMRDNGWWLGAIVASAQSQPSVLEEARGHLTGYDSITQDAVNRAARTLRADAVTAVVAVPDPTAAAAPATAPPKI